MWALVLTFLPLGLVLYAVGKRALSRSPPGPMGIPGLGQLPVIVWRTATNPRHRLFLLMQELRNKYGDVVSFVAGTQEIVLLSGYETLREAFVINSDKFIRQDNLFIFSDCNSYDDPDFQEFVNKFALTTNQDVATLLTVFYRVIPVETALLLSPSNKKHFEAATWTEDLCRAKIDKIRKTYNATDSPKNYVEAYLHEQNRRGENLGTFTDFQLVKTIRELYVAGIDTTSSTLRWCLLYAALNPELQDRCHAEIIANIGKRSVTVKDKKQLHYCQAFLDETQRIATLLPMSIDHRAVQNTVFRGYKISSDAVILVNLYGLHHDEKLFPEPSTFNPDRFLTPEGQYEKSEFLNQFGIGKRTCLGEGLARMELFLFFVTYMQHFRFAPDSWTPEQQEQLLLGTEGVVHAPMDHMLIVNNRH